MKTEIPVSIQAVLRCSECNELLSCGPVYVVHESNKAICGRCSPSQSQPQIVIKQEPGTSSSTSDRIQRDRSRNVQYEAAAQLLSFPCRYSSLGCPEKLDFSAEEPNKHERGCKYQLFIRCPITSENKCEWVDSRRKLGEHCRDSHPERFFHNSCILPRMIITKSYLCNYLISAFNLLFLLHVKVCAVSGKFFHSVRMFRDSNLIGEFSYSFKIEGHNTEFRKIYSTLSSESIAFEESTANGLNMNNLKEFFDDKCNELKFIFRIEALFRFCVNCFKNIDNVSDSKFCGECKAKIAECSRKRCLFMDVYNKKCSKHEKFFCEYGIKCCLCEQNFGGSTFIEHLTLSNSCRKTIKSNLDTVVRVTHNTDLTNKQNFILFSSNNNIGTSICAYRLSNSNFKLWLYTSFSSYELKNFKCSIKLTDPQTKYSKILTPAFQYNEDYDWYIDQKLDKFSFWQSIGIDIKINIEKM